MNKIKKLVIEYKLRKFFNSVKCDKSKRSDFVIEANNYNYIYNPETNKTNIDEYMKRIKNYDYYDLKLIYLIGKILKDYDFNKREIHRLAFKMSF